ncbi:M23 family metallopeptidase [bacterium]|nr:M23 family metallopeptidase [bacterium]MBU1995332.1 M23 family metallopeptidase [bacterium]
MYKVFILIFLGTTLFASNIKLDRTTIANGQSVFLELAQIREIEYEKIDFMGKSYPIYKHQTKDAGYYSILPISYYEKAKKDKVVVHYLENLKPKAWHVELSVIDGNYEKEVIKVSNSKVNLNKKDNARAEEEQKEAMRIYNTTSEKSYISSEFIVPLDSKITSGFGKARIYNDTLKGYHSGTDFRAEVGIPIKASNDGVVVLAKERFYSGGSVILDHGHGIYTCYFHMSKFNVQKGDKVHKTQIIGLSGDSGRVTGPHLHFSARVSGVQVDPLQLIELLNKKLF